ncbi:antitermination protein [Enterobacter roggenkampii]|uniref:transcriptional antitermination N peptide n=1 Tax=Enterobacter roggenkampii TaxID=1812935 RepID=UPI00254D9361|nr:antitermination protein [Enterobacter roggenkampii]MDL0009617.1 antitermination protein [Enterobacter roggenkampii]MED5760060.1 antitermination protein [Enterobacter roggenkampii]
MTRRTAFKGSSAARRRERLKAQAIAKGVEAREEVISSEKLHRPTLSRAQIQAKGKHETPKRIEDAKPIKFIVQDAFWQLEEYKRNLERAAIVYANEFGRKQDVSGAVCLPDVALFAAGHRTSKQVTAR